jgi:hypothetical protein
MAGINRSGAIVLILRSASLFMVFCFALSWLPTVQANEAAVRALRDDKIALFWYGSRALVNIQQLPVSDLPSGHPFKAIGLNVVGPAALDLEAFVSADDGSESLPEFARRAMQARLDELGASAAVRVAVPFGSHDDIAAPTGTTPCDLLSATIAFQLHDKTIDNLRISALTISFMATQQVSTDEGGAARCPREGDRQQWTYAAAPRVVLLQGPDAGALLALGRDEVLRLIDYEIVPRILDTNDAAKSTVDSWIEAIDWKTP